MHIKKWLLFLIVQLLISQALFSQIIRNTPAYYPPETTFSASCPGAGCIITLPKANLNQLYTIAIPIDAMQPVDSFNISNVTGSCTEINNNHTINNTANTVEIQVDQRCNVYVSSTLNFTLNAYYNSVPESQQFVVPIIRDTAKLVLTLDVSGSMILPVQSGSGTRIDALKSAVNMLVPKLVDFGQEGDSLSLTYFSSNVIKDSPVSLGFKPTKVPSVNIIDTVINDLSGRVPLQMTALGEGLLDAKNKINLDNSPNLNRVVFLFTDGLQNWGNQVKPDGISYFLTLDSLNNLSTNPKDSIKYFPVATWAAGDEPQLLQDIAINSGGEVLYVAPNTDALIIWFNLQLANMLESGSPQIVLTESLNNFSGEDSLSFKLNDHVEKLLVELVADEGVEMSVFYGSTQIDSKARVRTGDNHSILTFEFPIIDDPVVNSGGEWKIKLNGDTQNPVVLSVMADDHFLKYQCTTDKDLYTVGDSVHIKTNLSHLGIPISGAGNNVTAIVLKPGEDLGDLLATTETPELNDSLKDIDSGASQKFNELMLNDTAFFNSLLPEEQIINLTDVGNGEFIGSFKETELAGIYNIIYLMNGEIPAYGEFKRTKTISKVFVFGQVVEEQPEEVDNAPAPSSGNQKPYTVLRIRPKNKFGKYMGPGFMARINVIVNPKMKKVKKASLVDVSSNRGTEPYLEEIKDNLDGSYYLYIANLAPGTNADIQVTVREEKLYEGKIHPTPTWFYIIAIIILLLLILLRMAKSQNVKLYKILLWILIIIWLIILILHNMGILHVLY